MPTLEQCSQRCFTLFFEDYGASQRLKCSECMAAEERANRLHAGIPGGDRRDLEVRLADTPGKSQAA